MSVDHDAKLLSDLMPPHTCITVRTATMMGHLVSCPLTGYILVHMCEEIFK